MSGLPIVIPWSVYGPNQPLQIPILSAAGYLDLTTLTSPALQAERPDGSTLSSPWVPSILPLPPNDTVIPTAALLSYAFAQYDLSGGSPGTDAWRGIWRITWSGTIAGSPVTGITPTLIRVVNQWGL